MKTSSFALKVSEVIIKHYKYFTLCAKVLEKDLNEYNDTHNEDLLLFKYCENGRPMVINQKMVHRHTRQAFHQKYLKERQAKGFRSV